MYNFSPATPNRYIYVPSLRRCLLFYPRGSYWGKHVYNALNSIPVYLKFCGFHFVSPRIFIREEVAKV